MTGKFSSTIDELIWSLSLDGGPDEECGDVQTTGWYGLMREITLANLVQAAQDSKEDFKQIAEDEEDRILDVVQAAGAILFEDSQGFVEVTVIDDDKALQEKWDAIMAECGEESDEEPEEEEEEAEEPKGGSEGA